MKPWWLPSPMRAMGLATIYPRARLFSRVAQVAEFMRQDVLTVKPQDGIIEVAQQMLLAKPKIYPVVDDAGHLVGIIHRRDVLRCIEAQMRSCFKTAV